ncbi:MAG: hypothetical protein MUC50_13565 [Myxococcota bacterium]|nr:hypothetical protein [Myxococcota bacterium]
MTALVSHSGQRSEHAFGVRLNLFGDPRGEEHERKTDTQKARDKTDNRLADAAKTLDDGADDASQKGRADQGECERRGQQEPLDQQSSDIRGVHVRFTWG